MNSPRCRSCGSEAVDLIGRLPDVVSFAGRNLADPLPGGSLWRCRTCGFLFRDPLLTAEQYEALYRGGSLDIWDTQHDREDFRLVRRELNGRDGTAIDVLDVGCYTGQLLLSLPKSFRIYGIEPSQDAAKVAAARGVHIIAATVDELACTDRKFDVITVCDVVEHVPDPAQFLRILTRMLAPEGCIIVTSGNSDAWLWRFAGADFWYCYFGEHISFIGDRWLDVIPKKFDLELVKVLHFNYLGGGMNLSRIAAAVLYKWSASLYRRFARALRGSASERAPGCGATADHLLCVIRPARHS